MICACIHITSPSQSPSLTLTHSHSHSHIHTLTFTPTTCAGSFAALAGSHPEPPTPLWGKLLETGRPLPTGAFWTNLVLQSGDSPIGLYPYAVKTTALGVEVSHAAFRRHISEKTVVDPFVQDLRVGSAETYVSHAVAAFDSMSVYMAFRTTTAPTTAPTPSPTPSPTTNKKGEEKHGETVQQSSDSKNRNGRNGGYTAYLVKSTPFVTVEYHGVTPVLGTEMRIMAFEEASAATSVRLVSPSRRRFL